MAKMQRVTTSSVDGVETIIGSGELDLYVVEAFKQALSEAVATANEVVVDLRQASYVDTAIVAALVAPAKALLQRGARLRVLVTDGSYPRHVLKTLGFADLMEIVAGG